MPAVARPTSRPGIAPPLSAPGRWLTGMTRYLDSLQRWVASRTGARYTLFVALVLLAVLAAWGAITGRSELPMASVMALLLALVAASAWRMASLLRQLARRNDEEVLASKMLARIGELQAFVAQVNQAAAQLDDERPFLQAVCELAIDEGKLALALVARPDDQGRFEIQVAAGRTSYADGLSMSIDPDRPEGQGPAGCAWREDQSFFNSDFRADWLAPWRQRAHAAGLKASATLLLRRGDQRWGLLILYRGDDVAFDPPMQRVLRELADDVGHGLERIARSQRLHLLDTAVAALSDGLSILDARRDVIQVNRAFSTITGYRPEEVMGRSLALLHAPDADPAGLHALREALAAGRSYDGQIRNLRKDGTPFWNQLHIDPVRDAQGCPTHFVAVLRDVTGEREALDLQHALLENTTSGILIARERSIVAANTAMGRLLGREPAEFLGRNARMLYPDDAEYARGVPAYAQLRATGSTSHTNVRLLHTDGRTVPCDVRGRLLPDGQTAVWTFSDVTEREAQAQRLQRAQAVYRALAAAGNSLLQSATEAAMISRLCQSLVEGTEFSSVWLGCLDEAGALHALGKASVQRQDLVFCDGRSVDPADGDAAVARAWRVQATLVHRHGDAPARQAATAPMLRAGRWVALLDTPVRRNGRIWGVLEFVAGREGLFDQTTRDACEQVAALLGHGLDELDRKRTLQHLQASESRRARTDALTGLPNRLALEEHLPGALAHAERRQSALAIGMLDLDDFKRVNDRFGHAAGDLLLQRLAQALRERVRQADFLVRLGGDEFVVVFENLHPERALAELRAAVERLHGAVQQGFDLGEGRSVSVGMTMGLALYPQDAEEPDTLLRLADAAMYSCKAQKFDRPAWWRIGPTLEEAHGRRIEHTLDAFDQRARALLRSLDAQSLEPVATAFAASFYDELAQHPEHARILGCLDDEQLRALKSAQAAHLRFLLDPQTTAQALQQRAQGLGQVHALVGLSGASVERTFALYEDLLREQLENSLLSARQRYLILRVATARLRLDVQTQLGAIDQTTDAYAAILRTPINPRARWVDELPAALQALAGLPGICHALVFRPDEHGVLRVEAGAGDGLAELLERLQSRQLHPNLNPDPEAQRGPLSMAWFAREVQVVDAYLRDPRLARWRAMAGEQGWRSAATLPIADGADTDSIVMLFGRHVHQFSSTWARSWLELLRGRFDSLFAATARGHRPMEPAQVRLLRELLYGQGLRMWVQPIADLRTGELGRVEALARLHAADGRVYAPAEFLPAFGEQEMHALFRQGMRQALGLLAGWHAEGMPLDLDIALNVSPITLAHADCPAWIEQALRAAEVAPRHLTLEVLEGEDLDPDRAGEAMHGVDALGVRLALDDLGSGYSSLTRLASLPIDTVKIDQGLIRELPRQPVKTIRLLATLIGIGHEFARRTVVEGLEDEGLIEVARLLGAQFGQGFGLARPMPAADFAAWVASRRVVPATDCRVETWAGALACHWVGMRGPLPSQPIALAQQSGLAQFLQQRASDDPQALRLHRQWLRAVQPQQREQAARQLLHWLERRVRQHYAQPPQVA